MESLLITGGSGLLGSNLARLALSRFEVYATYRSHPAHIPGCEFVCLDIRDKEQTLSVFKKIKPQLVIHAAASAKVDYCEEHHQETWAINVVGTESVVMAASEIKAKLIYISTDSVFDGEHGMYREKDTPYPVNTYARTKLEGERAVQRLAPDSIIARTAFYGWSLREERSLAEWVVSSLREGKDLKMFTDVFFSPIFTSNLAEALIEMYQRSLRGLYHVAGSERCSKYHFGQEIARVFELDSGLIQPGSIIEAGLKAPRPKDISLDVSKASGEIDTQLLDVNEGIKQFKEEEDKIKALREMQCIK